MATAAVCSSFLGRFQFGLTCGQSPPLYLRVTSTSKEGLESACEQINELMQQQLPNLVDERRFRRREPENVERDEYGRVIIFFGINAV
jgi:hypothetical protein